MKTWAVAVVVLVAAGAVSQAGEPGWPGSFRDVIASAKPGVACITAARTPAKVVKDSFVDFINPFPLHTIPADTVALVLNVPLAVLFPADRKAMGSGFVISPDGHVVTNHHVIDRANRIEVELPDKRTYTAQVVGADPFADIALLKVDTKGRDLPALVLGDSDELREGDWVVAIGSPFGLKWTCTAGIVSAVGRDVGATQLDDLIQMEASLDSGNSGGPLINSSGQVVGVNTAAIFLAENKGFAVPINMVKEVLPDLEKHGRPQRGWLGVTVTDLTADRAREDDLDIEEGALLVRVRRRSPAGKAGLKAGDVIVEFDGQKVTEARTLARLARQCTVGDLVKVTVYRENGRKTVSVVVGRMKRRLRIF